MNQIYSVRECDKCACLRPCSVNKAHVIVLWRIQMNIWGAKALRANLIQGPNWGLKT